MGRQALQIEMIEVHAEHRLRGIGTSAVSALIEAFPDRRLVAFSEAHGFWASLKWDRFEHPEHARAVPVVVPGAVHAAGVALGREVVLGTQEFLG